jgi:hypothetical protein
MKRAHPFSSAWGTNLREQVRSLERCLERKLQCKGSPGWRRRRGTAGTFR